MNVGISSSHYQPFASPQLLEGRLPSESSIENTGSVLKPVAELAKSADIEAAAARQSQPEKGGGVQQNDAQKEAQQQLQEQRLDAQQQRVEQQQIQQLAARDREVRNHERAHAAVGGQYAGAPRYQFERGPDGINYAVGGEVAINAGGVSGDPQATIEKAQVVRRAALAPAEPSAQDRKVAAQATQMEAEARVELANIQREERLAGQEERTQENEKGGEALSKTAPLGGSQPSTSASADDSEPKPLFSSEKQSDEQNQFNQQLNELNRRITSSNANGLYAEPGQLLNQIV